MSEVGYMAHRQKMLHTPVLRSRNTNISRAYNFVEYTL